MLTALVFIIVLGLLIFVHELGHFLLARRNGIAAEEFGFGFPPRIFGFQILTGQKIEKVAEKRTEEVQISDYQIGSREIIEEKVTDRIQEIDQIVPVKKWNFIFGKKQTVSNEAIEKGQLKAGTVYSLNWIPLGGFVKIKGEDGSERSDPDSFAGKSAWTRIKVLAAGIIMNFLLAWLLLAAVYAVGAPQPVDESQLPLKGSKIQISQIIPGSPAELMGMQIGDEIVGCKIDIPQCAAPFSRISDVQKVINDHKGREIAFEIKRGKKLLDLEGTPRLEHPADQGALGISLVQTAVLKYPWYEALIKGFETTFDLIVTIFVTLADIIKGLVVGEKVAVDVSGPVGIAYLTKQVTELGLVYILQFAALLSINLGIINGLPFPALDGGRILFILIEKLKGSPVSRKVEQLVHTIGFVLLIVLMIAVTMRDILRFEVIEKIENIFGA
ncbi:MAG: RIP metalloprotease RseP [Candidatus Moranbacteria bacterium]|nr:RIP metalloprotease RseP [Candidatus Moranbacteria bacterium]